MSAASTVAETTFPALRARFDVPPGSFKRQQQDDGAPVEWLVWRAYDVPGDDDLLLLWETAENVRVYAEDDAPGELRAMVECMRLLEPGIRAQLEADAEAGVRAGLQ